MNRILSRAMAIVAMMLLTSMSATAQVLEDFYTYYVHDFGYKVRLTAGFKAEVNKASDGMFTDSEGFTWKTGDPLPNPAPDGMYNGKKVNSLESMFSRCEAVSLNLSLFNTTNVTDMSFMFYLCEQLVSVDLSSFNTENVKNMEAMFMSCKALSSLNLSNFNTANVTKMSQMFSWCQVLSALDLSSFNTAKVTDMQSMFNRCNKLESLTLPSTFTTAEVTDMFSMFSNCSSLTSLDLSNFNTAKVTGMRNMFYNCSSLSSLYLTNFDLSSVTESSGMFNSCGSSDADGNPTLTIYVLDETVKEQLASLIDNTRQQFALAPIVATVTSAGGATFVAPVDLDFSSAENIKAYYVKGDLSAGKVTLTATNTAAKGEAVLLLAEGGATEEIKRADSATAAASGVNGLKGVTETIDALASYSAIGYGSGIYNYILNDGAEGLGFYSANNQRVDAGKAYLTVAYVETQDPDEAKFLSWDFGETTAIDAVDIHEAESGALIYNMQGQRLSKPVKGINIIRGRKILVK